MNVAKLALAAILMGAAATPSWASVVTVLPNTTWGSIPGENTGGGNAVIDGTAPRNGNGSVELTGDRSRYTNGNYYDTSGNGLYRANTVSALTFDWRVAATSLNPYNPDYTPALRLHIYDPSTGKRSELIWEGAYNNVYGNETKDTWYTTSTSDLFYQNVAGSGVTLNQGSQVNQTLAAWLAGYGTNAEVTALSIGVGSGASAAYDAFADDVTVYFTNATSTTYNFELRASTTAVPEPASVALLGVGLAAAGMLRRSRRKA